MLQVVKVQVLNADKTIDSKAAPMAVKKFTRVHWVAEGDQKRELRNLRQAGSHANVISLIGTVLDSKLKVCGILTEVCDGTLTRYLSNHPTMSGAHCLRVLQQVRRRVQCVCVCVLICACPCVGTVARQQRCCALACLGLHALGLSCHAHCPAPCQFMHYCDGCQAQRCLASNGRLLQHCNACAVVRDNSALAPARYRA
jgi:hypothetical protein